MITLGVIGVVAAITIPQIVSNIEKQKTLSILKRAYRDLFIYVREFDYANDCNGSLSNCAPKSNEFIQKFSEYLINEHNFVKVTKNNLVTQTCIKFQSKQPTLNCMQHASPKYLIKSQNGYTYGIGVNMADDLTNSAIFRGNFPEKYTADYFRAIIWIYTAPYKQENSKSHIGYDMFSAFVMQSEDIVPNGADVCGYSQPPYGWTYFCADWETKKTCNLEEPESNGYGCLSRIIEEGWQINYR